MGDVIVVPQWFNRPLNCPECGAEGVEYSLADLHAVCDECGFGHVSPASRDEDKEEE